MEPISFLKNRLADNWLICPQSNQLQHLIQHFSAQLTQFPHNFPPKIILAEREPVRFIAGFIVACTAKSPIFICNPDWGEDEWQQVLNLVQPDIIWGNPNFNQQCNHTPIQNPIPNLQNSIMIPTGGSSGKIRFAIHTWETLTASVTGFQEYFQVQQVNSFCILPLYHVSGLMQLMRSFTSKGKLIIQNWKKLELKYNIEPTDFISLVPTQLQRLLQNQKLTTWLSQFKTVLLGGAPAWDELLEQAKYYKIRLAITYGMTETASQIATLKPEDFLNGKVSCGNILPHATVTICNYQGKILQPNQIGNITIKAKSLALGYYPQASINQDFLQLDDLGFFDNQGHLNIIGRSSDKIITGGENVYPAEIEAIIKDTQLVKDVCVIGIPDQQWGQAVIAIYVPKLNTSAIILKTAIKHKLSNFKIPKHWLTLENLPRNSQGKINRKYIQQLATTLLQIQT